MKTAVTTSLLLLTLFCAPATAVNLVTFQITAVVDNVVDPLSILGSSIMPGDTLTGILQYDLDLPDMLPDPNTGEYSADPPGDNFINGTNAGIGFFETSLVMTTYISNDDTSGLGSSDEIFFGAVGDTTPSLLAHPSVDFVDLFIDLIDTDGTVFSDDSLPATLNLTDFEQAELSLSGDTFDSNAGFFIIAFAVDATITSITQIPEPSTLLLGALASVGLLMRRRRLS